MKTIVRITVIVELLLVFPATLFMVALFLRGVQPAAQTGRFVDWFSALPVPVGLDLLMVVLPFTAFVIGCVTLFRSWHSDAGFRQAALGALTLVRSQSATLLIAGVTLLSGCILVVVAIHMLAE